MQSYAQESESDRLNNSERVDLRAHGHRPVQVWARHRDQAFWDEVLAEAREVGRAEDEAALDLFMEAAAEDTFRLIDEMERKEGILRLGPSRS